jgi:hypothetical protein
MNGRFTPVGLFAGGARGSGRLSSFQIFLTTFLFFYFPSVFRTRIHIPNNANIAGGIPRLGKTRRAFLWKKIEKCVA